MQTPLTPFVSTIMFVPIMSAHAKGGTVSDTSAAAPRAREVLNGVRTRLQNVELRAALERAAFLRDLHSAD